MEWRPIAEAPRDDTEVLGFGFYIYPGNKARTIYYGIIAWEDDAWSSWEGKHADGCWTHFMPLPPAPQPQQGKEGA